MIINSSYRFISATHTPTRIWVRLKGDRDEYPSGEWFVDSARPNAPSGTVFIQHLNSGSYRIVERALVASPEVNPESTKG